METSNIILGVLIVIFIGLWLFEVLYKKSIKTKKTKRKRRTIKQIKMQIKWACSTYYETTGAYPTVGELHKKLNMWHRTIEKYLPEIISEINKESSKYEHSPAN